MTRHLFAAAAFAGTVFCATPVMAEPLSQHTFLLTWADENCADFTYAEDLLTHAHRDVMDAPEAEVAALREKTEAGLRDIYEGDKADYCDTILFLIENPDVE